MEENRAQLTSILFPAADAATVELATTQPDCFPDLALDQVVDRVLGTDEYELGPVFWTPLSTLEQVEFRHAVLADLAHERVQQSGRAFAEGMRGLGLCVVCGSAARVVRGDGDRGAGARLA